MTIETFEITAWHDQEPEQGKVFKALGRLFKKFVFQLEAGHENGTKHWQIRGVSHKPQASLSSFLVLTEKFQCMKNAHIRPLSKNCNEKRAKFSYVMKEDTKLEGPWTDEDEEPVLTTQLKKFMAVERYPWQKKIEELAVHEDDRYITVFVDPKGNSGKSIMCEWLEYFKFGEEIPPFPDMVDIMQFAMSMKPAAAYLIDLPRGMNKKSMQSFYNGLECLKNGFLYDKRHCGKKRRINRPQVFVFSNEEPDYKYLIRDRWQVYKVIDHKDIEKVEISD